MSNIHNKHMKPRDRKIYVIKHRYYFLHAHLNIMKNLFAKVERTSYFIYSVTTLQTCQKLVLRFIKNFSDTSSFKTFLIFPFLIKHQKLNRAENIWVFFRSRKHKEIDFWNLIPHTILFIIDLSPDDMFIVVIIVKEIIMNV